MIAKSVLILDNIRSEQNVASIFRTADCAGISKIYLCGITPCPIDRFGRIDKKISKISLGAEKTVAWEKCSDTISAIKELKKDGFQIIAVEQSEKSIDYKEVKPKFPIAIVMGMEVEGISKEILTHCDIIAEIPMRGQKESLNVSVATGIAVFKILNI